MWFRIRCQTIGLGNILMKQNHCKICIMKFVDIWILAYMFPNLVVEFFMGFSLIINVNIMADTLGNVNWIFKALNQIILLPLKALGLPATRAETVWVKTSNPTGQHGAVHIAHLIHCIWILDANWKRAFFLSLAL